MDRVIVERLTTQTKSSGGVLLPEKAQTKINEVFEDDVKRKTSCQGLVVAVGPGGRTPTGALIPVPILLGLSHDGLSLDDCERG